MGNKVNVELGQNIKYADLEKGDFVIVGSDSNYIVAHVGNLQFQLVNIASGQNRYHNPLGLYELTKKLKEESAERRIRYFKNSTLQLELGKEFIPYP